MIPLRSYQRKAVDDIYTAFEDGAQAVCFTAMCGSGKTIIMAEMARLASEHGTSTVILTHRDSLIQQTCDKLDKAGVSYSVIAPGRNNYGDKVQVASVQTLARRPGRYQFGFIIVDECHRALAPSYRKVFAEHPEALICGFTASPARTNGAGLDGVFDRMVLGPTPRQLIDGGFLAQPVTYGALHKLDLSGVRTVAGDYNIGDLEAATDKSAITGDAIKEYSRLCPGEPAMAFCCSISHAEHVANDFRTAGYRAEHVSGAMPRDIIRQRLADLADGRIQVLTSCDLAGEGIDIGSVRASILLRATKSIIVYIQQAGRALRTAPGKKNALILDHAGSFMKFGLIDDEREWALEGKKKRACAGDSVAAVPARQCPKCYVVSKPSPTCPACGHIYLVEVRKPEVIEGELAIIDAAALRRARVKEERVARTYKELQELARRRNYSIAWPMRKWCERGNDPAKAV